MNVKEIGFKQFFDMYKHPSAAFFRAVELKTIFDNLRNESFSSPSLDVGCGDGRIAKLLFTEKFSYGLDNGEAKDVEAAVKNHIYGQVLLESAERISLPDDSLRFVFSNCVLEHIPDNRSVLREISRILTRNGDFVFTVPSHHFSEYLYLTDKLFSAGLGAFSRFYKYRRNKMLNQFHCYSIQDWKTRLAAFGFSIEAYQYYMSKEALMLWDRMALEIFFTKIVVGDKAMKRTTAANYKKMHELYVRGLRDPEEGAAVFIWCKKTSDGR